MMSLSLLGASLPMSDSAVALTISISVMLVVFAATYVLVGLSILLAGAYPAVPVRGRKRVFQYLPFAIYALIQFALGGFWLHLSTYNTFTVPSLDTRQPGAWTILAGVIAVPVIGILGVALHIFFLLRRRARYLRASAGNQ